MSGVETLRILPKDVSGGAYRGRSLSRSDVVSIDPRVRRITFRNGIDVKALTAASGTEIAILGDSRIVHLMISAPMAIKGTLFCGSIETTHDLIVHGDLTTWASGMETTHGNIIVSGDLSSAGRVLAKNGVVIVNGDVDVAEAPLARYVWSGKSGVPLPTTLRDIAKAAGEVIRRIR